MRFRPIKKKSLLVESIHPLYNFYVIIFIVSFIVIMPFTPLKMITSCTLKNDNIQAFKNDNIYSMKNDNILHTWKW
jgi:hypothetical protein